VSLCISVIAGVARSLFQSTFAGVGGRSANWRGRVGS